MNFIDSNAFMSYSKYTALLFPYIYKYDSTSGKYINKHLEYYNIVNIINISGNVDGYYQ